MHDSVESSRGTRLKQHTILVPLDGSPLAERALPYAEVLATALRVRLLLVRATPARPLRGSAAARAYSLAAGEAAEYLAGIAARLARWGVVETAVFNGDAAEAIIEESRVRKADLIVMATHGRSGIGRWVFGSVAEAVLNKSVVPVLCVRAWRDTANPDALVDHPRVIVPLDGSPFAEKALPVALNLVDALDGAVVLVRAVPVAPSLLSEQGSVARQLSGSGVGVAVGRDVQALAAEADAYLHRVAHQLALDHPNCELDVRLGTAAACIMASGTEHQGALVVMASHGRTGLGRMLLGSVAHEVLQNGTLPLLLVRPDRKPTTA